MLSQSFPRSIRLLIAMGLALIACPFLAAQEGGNPQAVFDDLTNASGWQGPLYTYGVTETGDGTVEHGLVRVVHRPVTKYHMVSMEKTYPVHFSSNTAVHFLVKMPEILLGADMYTHIWVDNRLLALIGFNGEQHWQQFQNCVPKRTDDELFFASDVINNQNKDDLRVQAPGFRFTYADWTLFSVKYEESLSRKSIRVFVNGEEIVYRDIDAAYPSGGIDNSTHYRPSPGPNEVRVSFGVFSDGDEYANLGDPQGTRYRNCFASLTPAVPTTREHIAMAERKDAEVLWDYVIISSPESAETIFEDIKALSFAGRLPLSPASAIELGLISWQHAQFNCPYLSYAEIAAVRQHVPAADAFCLERVKGDIYAGHIGTADAVLQGGIAWQQAQFACPYVSYAEIAAVRQQPEADVFCLERVKGDLYAGRIGTAAAVLQGAIAWQQAQFECPYMSEAEKNQVRNAPGLGAATFCRS